MESLSAFLERPEGRLGVALAVGLVIGAERERRMMDRAVRPEAGIRTFALVALLGVIVSLLENPILLVCGALFVGIAALSGQLRAPIEGQDRGLTSEVALVLTYVLGALAERSPGLALGAGLCVATLLALRTPIHAIVRTVLSERELRDALLFGIAAVVVLPLLPNHAIDPLGVLNLFVLWRLVVLMMGMSAIGYIAERAIGPRFGLALAGFGSGFISSSATIAAMGARARADQSVRGAAVAGAAASTVATFVQLAMVIGTASPSFLGVLWPVLLAGGGTALAYALAQMIRARGASPERHTGHAFNLGTAASFALLVAFITLISTLAERWFGQAGALVAAALAGLADAHAAAAAVAALVASGKLPPHIGALGVLAAVSTNTLTKMLLTRTAASRSFSLWVISGLVLVLVAAWAALAIFVRA